MEEEAHATVENKNQLIKEKKAEKLKPNVLDSFITLTNDNEKVRVKSGALIIKYLKENDNTDKERNELNYVLNRLIRGLGSTKVNSKAGFYSTLVALLKTNNITLNEICDYIDKELKTGGNNLKSENADISAGQILACGAVIRSGLFEKSTHEEQKKIIELLLTAGKKRSYLTLASFTYILELLAQVDQKTFKNVIWPVLQPELANTWENQTLDTTWAIIAIQNKYPKLIKDKLLEYPVGCSDLVVENNLKSLCNLLMNVPFLISTKHPVYTLISSKLAASTLLIPFIKEADNYLVRPNRNRYIILTVLLKEILKNLKDTSVIPELLTCNYIQQTLNIFRSSKGREKDKEFEKNVYGLFNNFIEVLKGENVNSTTKTAVLKKLLIYPGTLIFEKITRSKIIQQIINCLDTEGVKSLAKLYKKIITGENDKFNFDSTQQSWINKDRVYVAQLFVKLLNHQAVQNELEWKIEQLKFLMHLSLIKNSECTNIGVELANAFKETFFRSLDKKFSKLDDLCQLLFQLVDHLNITLNASELSDSLRYPLSEDAFNIWKRTYKLITSIESKSKKNHTQTVFLVLFLHMNLQLFGDTKLAIDSLNELFSCYERTKQSKKIEDVSENQDPLWIEVVVELFLSLLSHKSHLLRSVINCVFPHLCRYINATAVHQLLSVFDVNDDINPLSMANESSDSENDDNDESSSEEEVSDDNEEEKETVNDKLRVAVRKALGTNGYQTDEESIDIDDISDSEAKRLDDALSNAFKQFKPNRGKSNKKQSKDDETLTHFRVRVLDLIEIYLDSNPSMLLCFEIMLPLLQMLEFCIRNEHQKPLEDRTRACLKKLCNLKKFSNTDEVDENVLKNLLESLLKKGTKTAIIIQDMGDKISDCCVFIIRCSQMLRTFEGTPKKTKKKLKKAVIEILENELNDFFKKKSLTPYVLFKNTCQLNWIGNINLAEHLLTFVFDNTIRQFRQYEAMELLKIFYSNHRLLSMNNENISEKLNKIENNFAKNTLSFLQKLNEEENDLQVKEKFICCLFNLLSAIKTSPLKNESFDWVKIGECVREYRSHVTLSKDTKVAYSKLCKSLGISNIVQMKIKNKKRNSETIDDTNEEIKELKKKKKKKNVKSMKLKKESQMLRLKSLSEGLPESFSFTSTNVDEIQQSDDLETDEDQKNFKKHTNKRVNNNINEVCNIPKKKSK